MRRASFLVIVATLALYVASAYAAVTVTVNGSNHTIPQTNEKGWGTNVTAWIQSISQFTLQNSGGTFTLTADTNFGADYGLLSQYYKSRSSNISSSGVLRLANTDTIGWRDNANGANLLLSVDSSDRLLFNGVLLPSASLSSFSDAGFTIYNSSDDTKKIAFSAAGIGTTNTRTITMPDADVDLGALVNANISASAAIVDTKLDTIATAGKVSNSATTATALNTNDAIVARDAGGSFSATSITADIAGSLTGNADTATALASNPSDCSANTYATAIGASGDLTCAQVSATAGIGGTVPVTSGGTGIGTLSAGDLLYSSGSNTLAKLGIGTTSQVLTVIGGVPDWETPSTATVLTGGTERIERATVTCSSSSAITRQSGSWISAIGNVSSGSCSLTFSGFSALPTCVATVNVVVPGAIFGLAANVTSTTAATINCQVDTGGSAALANCTDISINVICMGAR